MDGGILRDDEVWNIELLEYLISIQADERHDFARSASYIMYFKRVDMGGGINRIVILESCLSIAFVV